MNKPTSRMREPSSWGGLAAMTLGAIPMTPEEFHGPLAIVAIVCGAVGLLMRGGRTNDSYCDGDSVDYP